MILLRGGVPGTCLQGWLGKKRTNARAGETVSIEKCKGVPDPAVVPLRAPVIGADEVSIASDQRDQIGDPTSLPVGVEGIPSNGVIPCRELPAEVRGCGIAGLAVHHGPAQSLHDLSCLGFQVSERL